MLAKLFITLANFSPAVKRFTWQRLYQYLARKYPREDWVFMNYGFHPVDPSETPVLNEVDEYNRYFIQLYDYVASGARIEGRDVLEVGSGRGGGASYINRYLQPKTMTGIDFSDEAVNFCRKTHRVEGLSFRQGDAEAMPFEEASFDVVMNVESSHCYGSMEKFVSEVSRVLRQNGYFLFADLRNKDDSDKLEHQLTQSNLHVVKKVDITPDVLRALEISSEEKLALVQNMLTAWIQKPFQEFAGIKGSQIYEGFKNNKMVYHHYVLKKGE
jgi:ubiquinone/menaquinone biosynthesis C-methylase UbiE